MKRMVLIPVLALAVGFIVACGDDDNSSKTATPAPSVTATPAASNVVNVGLQEWSINPEKNSAPAGDVTFAIKNIGPQEEHEFVILKTDLTPATLPLLQDGSVDEGAAGLSSPGEIEGIGAGASASQTFNLTAGHYIFICNIVDQNEGVQQAHFKEGMHTEFTVK